jgi:hypothetical protein
MSGETQGLLYLRANQCLILRSDAIVRRETGVLPNALWHRVSKNSPESFARSAHTGTPFEAPSGRLRARGIALLATRKSR